MNEENKVPTIEVAVEPFLVPKFAKLCTVVSRGDGTTSKPQLRLEDIPAETLSDMCDEFRTHVFNHAGKDDPKQTTMQRG